MIISLLIVFVGLLLIISSYQRGFLYVVLCKIVLPTTAHLFDVKLNIILMFLLLCSCIIRKPYKENPIPMGIIKITGVYLFLTTALMFFAFELSLDMQLISFVKKIINMLGLGFLGWFAFDSIKDIKKIGVFIVVTSVVICIYGCFEYIFKVNPIMNISTDIWGEYEMGADSDYYINEVRGMITGRIQGMTVHPLTWGQMLFLVLSFILLLSNVGIYKNKSLIIFTIILLLLNIFLTGSRSALIPTGIMLFVGFMGTNKKVKIISSGLAFLLIFVIIFADSVPFDEIFSSIQSVVFFWDESLSQDIGGSSMALRTEQLAYASKMIDGNMFTGYGYGYLSTLSVDSVAIGELLGVESLLLVLMIEQGFIGVCIFLLYFFQLFFYLKKQAKGYEKVHTRSLLLLIGFFFTYFLSLMMTGDRGVFALFFLFYMIYLKYIRCLKIGSHKVAKRHR